jgi:HK97 family phage major capsid protein
VKMTQEQLESTLKSMMTNVLKEQGISMSAQIRESIDEKVGEMLLPTKMKSYFTNKGSGGGDPSGGFQNLADFAQAVFLAEKTIKGMGPREIDPRLITKGAGTPSMAELSPEAGGYLIPSEFAANLLDVALSNSDLMKKCFLIPMAAATVNIPFTQGFDRSSGQVFGGVTFQWIEEQGEIVGVRPKFGQVGLRLRKCVAMCYTSSEMLEDSPITIEPLISKLFVDGLVWTMENALLNGSGVGQPLGIMNSPCLISIDPETGQLADTILYENILKMYQRMWRKSNMVWIANDDTLSALATMNLAIGTAGVPVYIPAGGASATPYDLLFGKPLFFSEHCRTLGDKGDIFACDWTQYLLGQKAGTAGGAIRFDSSMHLKFDFDQMAYRITFRIDGEPWWPTVLTPRYSAETKSPFLTLADRTGA